MYGPLNDPHFVLVALSCAAVITIGALVTALNRVPRAEFAQLQNELKELSERVGVLELAEQGRFMRELNTDRERAESSHVNGGAVDAAVRGA
jgi:hypothetical protein